MFQKINTNIHVHETTNNNITDNSDVLEACDQRTLARRDGGRAIRGRGWLRGDADTVVTQAVVAAADTQVPVDGLAAVVRAVAPVWEIARGADPLPGRGLGGVAQRVRVELRADDVLGLRAERVEHVRHDLVRWLVVHLRCECCVSAI